MNKSDIFEQPYKLAGHLHQVASDAVEKELDRLAGEWVDLAYWDVRLEVTVDKIYSDFEGVSKRVVCKEEKKPELKS
jgi:lipocalin